MKVLAEVSHRFDHVWVLLDARVRWLRVHEPLDGEIDKVDQLTEVSWQACKPVLVQVELFEIREKTKLFRQLCDQIIVEL